MNRPAFLLSSSTSPSKSSPQFRSTIWRRTLPPVQQEEFPMHSDNADPTTGRLLATLNPTRIQEVAAAQLVITDHYYENITTAAHRSFLWALTMAGLGVLFFLTALGLLFLKQPPSIALIAGGTLEALAALLFLLYAGAIHRLDRLHEHVQQTQRCLLANSICEHLQHDVQQSTYVELVRALLESLKNNT